MQIVTLDWETFYDTGYSLTSLTTEEYIRHTNFEEIGVGVKIGVGQTEWITGTREELSKRLRKIDWRNSALLCHNTMFDGAILWWLFKIKPKLYLDTLSMARAIHGVDAGGSLKALAERYGIGVKGEEVIKAKGKRRSDFSDDELRAYGEYCRNDVDLTYKLFTVLLGKFSQAEIELVDQTLRMFIDPALYIDEKILHERMIELIDERKQLLGSLKERLKCATDEEVAEKLSSNPKFAALLKEHHVEIPMKISPRTGKEAPALSKKDEGFLALCEHEDTFVQQLCAARLGVKSTIEESRIQRFIDVAHRNNGRLPIPLKYYGAHTGRWAGSDKVNLQNLPSRDARKKALKNAIIAPEGYVVINSDSSQIEARVLAWLAGQNDVVEAFAKKQDVYRKMASKIYDCAPEEVTKEQRFVGKTVVLGCGYGTGWAKLQTTLATSDTPVIVDEKKARDIISVYRATNYKIADLWKDGDSVIDDMLQNRLKNEERAFGEHSALWFNNDGVRLPSGFMIHYPGLSLDGTDTKNKKVVYKSRKGMVSIWGGSLTENVVQALARCIISEQLLEISAHFRVALTVHDSVVCVVPEDEVEQAINIVTGIMSTPPSWAPGLPVACEATHGRSYGDC